VLTSLTNKRKINKLIINYKYMKSKNNIGIIILNIIVIFIGISLIFGNLVLTSGFNIGIAIILIAISNIILSKK
ncbi:MAG: hypothetical protein OQK82_07075, partial [Candidatus Pacearchaeota archaeon]|nr:hypothetical protein [Candidatus Pacearchaeota archaeon]